MPPSRSRLATHLTQIGACALLVLAAATSHAQTAERVMVVSWDGIRTEVLNELLSWQQAGEAPIPCPHKRHDAVIPTLSGGGVLSCVPELCEFQMLPSMVLEGKPLTRPQHAQMLTGYGPLQTGVIANAGKKAVPPGLTIYERIKEARPEVATVHIGGRKFTGKGITKWAIKNGSLDVNLRRGGRDAYSGIATLERVVEALDIIGDAPFFMFVHFKAADVIGHRAGHKSTPYREAMIQQDLRLTEIKQLLASRGYLDSTEIIVSTDHGFQGIFHINPNDPNIVDTWLASMNPILMDTAATVQDITPTVLQLLGISFADADPPYPGRSLLAGPNP